MGEAAGRGVQFALREFFNTPIDLARTGLPSTLNGRSVVVQGFGNVGWHVAKFLAEDGCKIVAVLEQNGAVLQPDGINVVHLKEHFDEAKSFAGFRGGRFLTDGDALLKLDCYILVPAALEGVINIDNAADIRAKIVAEAANGPVTFEADRELRRRGKIIIPDLFANAGGVTVSYFEWVKNITHMAFGLMERRRRQHEALTLAAAVEKMTGLKFPRADFESVLAGGREIDLVRSGLEEKMRSAYREMSELWNGDKGIVDLRTAAYVIALRRIAARYEAVGI
nr:glutamate dehydrogenase [Bradyrhizobium sp. S69]